MEDRIAFSRGYRKDSKYTLMNRKIDSFLEFFSAITTIWGAQQKINHSDSQLSYLQVVPYQNSDLAKTRYMSFSMSVLLKILIFYIFIYLI